MALIGGITGAYPRNAAPTNREPPDIYTLDPVTFAQIVVTAGTIEPMMVLAPDVDTSALHPSHRFGEWEEFPAAWDVEYRADGTAVAAAALTALYEFGTHEVSNCFIAESLVGTELVVRMSAYNAAGSGYVDINLGEVQAQTGALVTLAEFDGAEEYTGSNGGMTQKGTLGSTQEWLHASIGRSAGKRMFQVVVHDGQESAVSQRQGVGLGFLRAVPGDVPDHIINSSSAVVGDVASTTNAIGLDNLGVVYVGGVSQGTLGATWLPGAVITLCADFDSDAGGVLLWWKINDGNWNGSGIADPATGTGGILFDNDKSEGLGGELLAYPLITMTGSSSTCRPACTIFCNEDEFSITPPSGFAAWDGQAGNGALVAGLTHFETRRLAQGMYYSTPFDSARAALADTLIGSLKSAGVFTKMGRLCILAAHDTDDAWRIDWISGAAMRLPATEPTGLNKVEEKYVKSASSAEYGIFTGAESTQSLFAQNNAHFGVVSRADPAGMAVISVEAGSASAYIGGAVGGGVAVRTNAAGTDSYTDVPYSGHICWTRAASGTATLYREGALAKSITRSSTALSSTANNMRMLFTTYTSNPPQAELCAIHMGSTLTITEVAAIRDALHTYLTAIGAFT